MSEAGNNVAEAPKPGEPGSDNVSIAPLTETPKFEESKTFNLSRPIRRLNGTVQHEITLRAPVALDLFEIGGLPTKTSWTQGSMSIDMDMERCQQYVARLSGIERPAIYQVAARDFRSMFDWLNAELNPSGN